MGLPPAQTFPFFDTDNVAPLYVGAALLRGWSFQESSGIAAASLIIYDGDPSALQIVASITLTANESTRDYPSGDGILLRTAAWIDIPNGSIQGALWMNPLSFAEDLAFAFGQSGPFYVPGGV